MWLQNTVRQRFSKSDNVAYLKLNMDDGNPAIRVSEKALQEVGWKNGDFINIYVDHEKIMMIKDNKAQAFGIHPQVTNKKSYGFTVYGKVIKEITREKNWQPKKVYPVSVMDHGDNEKIIVCFKDELILKADKTIRKYESKYAN
jgi:bifunctional DNA-binding transcriptional regulator/antitoxin component of YhaV-PrlF toxin-antitoxin module